MWRKRSENVTGWMKRNGTQGEEKIGKETRIKLFRLGWKILVALTPRWPVPRFPYPWFLLLATYPSIISIILPKFLSSGNHSPLFTHKIFILSWYIKSGNSLGVIRKYCALSGLQVTLTMELCTTRSARWSIPWSWSKKSITGSEFNLKMGGNAVPD